MTPAKGLVTKDTILGCVLAGGLSRRMGGGDKTLLDLGGKPMLSSILERLSGQTGQTILNANGDPARFAEFHLPVVADPIDGYAGPLAGILAGLRYARTNAPHVTHVVSIAGDTPFYPAGLVSRFLAALPDTGSTIVLASSGGKLQPVFGLWPVALCDDLHNWLATGRSGKVLAFVDRHPSIEVPFEPDEATGLDPFFNANRPDDLETARSAASLLHT